MLAAEVTSAQGVDAKHPVRAYAHCGREEGKLSVLLISLSDNTTVTANVSAGVTNGGYDLYRLQAGSERARARVC